MPKALGLAYSPCPNDTYIFAAWANGLLSGVPKVRVHLRDIDELNAAALSARYELTKISYGAIPLVMEKYRILRAGGALGRGCGPLLIARPGAGTTLQSVREKRIAIPGTLTTAFMLLRLAMGTCLSTVEMRFDEIVHAVATGTADAGLIIHESRFTYQQAHLVKVVDLGEWWERETGMPIPLGAILLRGDFGYGDAERINGAIRNSLEHARRNEDSIMPYVRDNATEMSEEVMRKHIALYVNRFSDDVGEEGIAAVNELFRRAHEAGIIPRQVSPHVV